MKSISLISIAIIFCGNIQAQKPFTANTLKLDTSVKRANYSIKDIAWIAGKWKGAEAFGKEW